MAIHNQKICTTLKGGRINVDERISKFIQKLWDAGIKTWTSCEWYGDLKYPAYINPCCPRMKVCPTPERMAEILGLKRWQWRKYNGVIWLHRSLIETKA